MPSRLAPLALITAIVAGCAPTPTTPSPSVSAALPSPTPTVAPPATSPSANAGCARATSVLANPRRADPRVGSVSSAPDRRSVGWGGGVHGGAGGAGGGDTG